jgi:hypothetical protein
MGRLIKKDRAQIETSGLRLTWFLFLHGTHDHLLESGNTVCRTFILFPAGADIFSHFHQNLAGSVVYITGDGVLFLRKKSGRSVKLTTHVNKVIILNVLAVLTSIKLLFILLCFGTRTVSPFICNFSMHSGNFVPTYSTISLDL